jgi:hypothetical protein
MKINALLILLFMTIGLASCDKEKDYNYAEGTVGRSKIVSFPLIETKGDKLIILTQGATYTEAGAAATLGGATATYTTSGTVNTAQGGVYNLTYTASNPEGYTASDWRTVVVIGNDVSANNFSGTYLRSVTSVTSTWTKTASGIYTVENPGGAGAGVGLTVIAVNYTGNKIAIPHQISPDFGEVSSGSESYTLTPAPPQYTWVFFAGGYGTGTRTFVKQ